MQKLHAVLFAGTTFFSLFCQASPELVPAAMLDYGSYKKVEEVTIEGDINEDIVYLAETNLERKDADFFVIDEINEDIDKNVLVLSVSLYNDLSEGFTATR